MWPTYTNKIEGILNNNIDKSLDSVLDELLLNSEDFISEVKRCNPKVIDYFRENPKIVFKLVEYISVESDNLSDVDRSFKFPLVSSEFFDCSLPCIMTQFFVESKKENVRTNKITNLQNIKPNLGDINDQCYDGENSLEISDQNKYASPIKSSSINYSNEDSPKKTTDKRQINFKWPLLNKLFEFLKPLTCINEVLAGYWSKLILNLISQKPQEMIEYMLTSTGVLDSLLKHISNQSIGKQYAL